ncbi:Hexaprenyldihydroxybenzoate methyltransferase, mitochondrial, partial [Coemansia sp. RSA 2681]
FVKVSDSWWNPQGPFKYLHTMNRMRTQFIRSHLADLSRLPRQETLGRAWIRGRRVVDIGCGGGLASESLARLGIQAVGVDAGEGERRDGMDPRAYVQTTAEQLVAAQDGRHAFDVVVLLEVIEHVADPVAFVRSLVDLAAPGASLFISTMNRMPVSLLVDVIVPEYVLGTVPRGTHDHSRFIAPEELTEMLRSCGAETLETRGLVLNPLTNTCHLVPQDLGLLRNLGVQANYIIAARKPKTKSK